MAPSDSRSVNRCLHGHLACQFPINVTVPYRTPNIGKDGAAFTDWYGQINS